MSTKSKIIVYTNTGNVSRESSLQKIFDIIEVEGIIICTGKDFIEVFQFIDNTLQDKGKFAIPNNGTIKSIILVKNIFICGHENGELSIWMPGNPILSHAQSTKLHNGSINKLYLKSSQSINPQTNEQIVSNFIITCSSDKSIKVINVEDNFRVIKELNLLNEVYNIYETKNFEKQEVFLVTLLGGKIIVLNNDFNTIFEINSRNNYPGYNMNCTAIENPCPSNTLSDFLIFSDGNVLNINIWIKDGSFQIQHHPNHPNPHYPNQPGRGRGRGKGGF